MAFAQRVISRRQGFGDIIWKASLGEQAADLATGFLLSTEFMSFEVTDEEFLAILYRALMNRQPDPGGFDGWLSQLKQGMSRADVIDRFTASEEFGNRCRAFGINPVSPSNPQ